MRAMEPIEDEDDVDRRPTWARALGLTVSSDDEDTLQRYFYGKQVNRRAGYVADEVVLSYNVNSWGLGIEAENVDLSGYKKAAWWRGVTLRVGPFHLTASRQTSEEF